MKNSLVSWSKKLFCQWRYPHRSNNTILDLQSKLEAANQRFEILAKATNDAIWEWDMQTNSITWIYGLKAVFGYDSHKYEHHFDTWVANIHPNDRELVQKNLAKLVDATQTNWSAIYRYRCFNGNYKYIFDRGYLLYQAQKPLRMISTMQDIDDRMIASMEIERLSLVASKTENLVIITDADERIEWVNESFIKHTGYALHEIIGKKPTFLQGLDTDRKALERISKGLKSGQHVTEEILNYTKEGKPFWLKLTINPIFDINNKPIKFIAIETDVSKQKEYEKKITTIAQDLSNLIENANALIFGIDRNGCINEWNQYATFATGYTKKYVMGKKLTHFTAKKEHNALLERLIQEVLIGNLISRQEFQLLNRSGEKEIILLNATPRRNASGEIVGAIAVGQDVTELTQYRISLEEKVKQRTQALNIAIEKEKLLVEQRNQFVAIASHEFRTPLSTINFTTNYLYQNIEELKEEEIRNKLKKIEKQVTHMTSLLEDVIMAGRTDLNKIPVLKTQIIMRAFIDRIIDEVQTTTKNTHIIRLHYGISSTYLETDEKLLHNILINLLTNAIKFSPEKETIELTLGESNNAIIVEVVDRGIGIPEKDMEKIFQSFYRGSNTNAISGTGLGLAIVKKAVEVLNGTVELQSKPNEGTAVRIVLPTLYEQTNTTY